MLLISVKKSGLHIRWFGFGVNIFIESPIPRQTPRGGVEKQVQNQS